MPMPDAAMRDTADRSGVKQSEEQIATLPTGIEICYQTFGNDSDEPLLLVMGLGGPMIWWPEELCSLLAARGFFVIRFDNRDTGHSSKLSQYRVRRADVLRAFAGRPVVPPYTLTDMAEDGFGLLDQLGIERAHVCGVSMGGMIAQSMAIAHPDRVLSLVSIMSTTGRRNVGWQHPRLIRNLLMRRPQSREEYLTTSALMGKLIGSPAYPTPDWHAEDRAERTWERGINPAGVLRQMLAITTQPNRELRLRDLPMPVAVMHGLRDRMVHVTGGKATARAVPGSELVLVPGMGHDIPPGLYATFADLIERTAARAR
jgi:pimeloyl-ACP methyl ester carboxylesterase